MSSQQPAPSAARIDPLTGQAVQVLPLRTQLADLQTRAAVLEAQRKVLMQGTRSDNPSMRSDAQGQLLRLDLDLATVRTEIASIEGRLSQGGGGNAGTTQPPPPPATPMIDPDAVTAVFVMTAIAILVPLSIGLLRRLWRRPMIPPASMLEEKLSPRLDRLEQAVDAIAIEVERISEGQRFVAKVLSERPPITNQQAQADSAAVGEGKPFLALGAGPMEPIRMAERQAVKQSITPH